MTEDILSKESRSYIKDYNMTPDNAQAAPVNQQTLLNLMDDPTVNGEVNKLVNYIMRSGYKIVKKENEEEEDEAKEDEWETKYNGYLYLRQLYSLLIILRNAFTEVVWKGEEPMEIWNVEPTNIDIVANPHGKVLGYLQRPYSFLGYTQNASALIRGPDDNRNDGNPALKDYVFWTPEEMIHFTAGQLDSNPWGYLNTQSLIRTVTTKRIIEGYVEWLFDQHKFRDIWLVKEANATQIKNFIQDMKDGRINKLKDLVVEGDIAKDVLRKFDDGPSMIAYLNYLKNNISEMLMLPPMTAGGEKSSNRSTGEFEMRWDLESTVQNWQDMMTWQINYKLFPLIGWDDVKLVHMPNDRLSAKDRIADAVAMKGIGVEDDIIAKYMVTGEFPDKVNFKELPQPDMKGNQQFQNKFAESRAPKDNMNKSPKSGTQSQTRDEQMMGKSEDIERPKLKFNQYPYVI